VVIKVLSELITKPSTGTML